MVQNLVREEIIIKNPKVEHPNSQLAKEHPIQQIKAIYV